MSDNLNIPKNRKQIFDNLSANFKGELPASNPTLKNSWLLALLMSMAGAFYEIYKRFVILSNIFFSYLTWSNLFIGNKLPATIATGYVSITGVATTIIPENTLLQSDGLQYKTLSEVEIASVVQNVSSLTWSAGVATVQTSSDHLLASGMSATIAGATPTGLNTTATITVTDSDKFTYTTTESGSGSATGTITITTVFASVQIESLNAGEENNQDAGTQLSPVNPISGASTAFVQYSEIVGGTDLETDTDYETRTKDRIKNPVANFNAAAIINKITELGFVKRIFVQTATPDPGKVTIYCLKANNDVPTSTELTLIKNKVLEIIPAPTSPAAIFVYAPTLVPTNYTFTSITPDTSTMQTAIQNSLTVFYETIPEIGTDITQTQYTNAIINTIDEDTGDLIEDYTLSSPSGTISISTGEIGTLGNVTFT